MLIRISVGFNNPIGIDHHEPTNKVVLSVNYSSGSPYNFELVAADGTRSQFSNISGLTEEVKIACVRSGPNQGGFQVGELFTGTGAPGVIARISPDGSSVRNPWVTLPGEPGLMRGSLFQDRYGIFGGDVVVVTTAGGIWRITYAGQATRLAQIGTHLEGVTTVPNEPAKYGPWAGKILAGAEDQGLIYTISASGTVSSYNLGISPEDIDIIPENENFYGVDFGGRTLWGAPPSAFAGMAGDILMAQEFPGFLWHVRWNPERGEFEKNLLAQVPQWEHVTFSTAGIDVLPPVPGTVEPCPPAAGPPPRHTTRLFYLGPETARCAHSLELVAQFTDETGRPLVGRNLTFAFGGRASVAATDSTGIARITVTPEASGSRIQLSITYAGEPEYLPASASATIDVVPTESALRYTGRALLALGTTQRVAARLTDAIDGRPLSERILTFEAGTQRAQGTTDANGVATTELTVPVADQPAEIAVSFAGDACHSPSSARAPITAYRPTSFVIWGGNPDGLEVGQRVNFWGAQWERQVVGGDYDAEADFKGYADLVGSLGVCQPDARTDGVPPLDRSCWTSKPGQSFPPEPPLPLHIGVIVATSIAKRRGEIYGNIAAVAVVKVDPNPPYGPVPGKPAFGTLVAGVEDGGDLFPQPPTLAASQALPGTVLPSERFAAEVKVSNVSNGAAEDVTVSQRFDDLDLAVTNLGSIYPGATRTASVQVAVPMVAPRQPDESNAAYLGRLENADGRRLHATATVDHRDAAGQPQPPLTVSSSSRLRLPRLAAVLTGTVCAGPGSEIEYEVTVASLGSAVAEDATLRLRFPDGTSREENLGVLEPGATRATTAEWTVPDIPPQGVDESPEDYRTRLATSDGTMLRTVAEVVWKDDVDNDYGPVEQPFSSVLRVPIVTAEPQVPAPLLPGARTTLAYAAQNLGSGNAFKVSLRTTSPNGSASGPDPFSIAGSSQPIPVQVASVAPTIDSKRPGESDAAYLERLTTTDGDPVRFEHALAWEDAAGNGYGPTRGSVTTTLVLPILELSLTAPPIAQSGDAISYTAQVTNRGHADAANVIVVFTLPDGSTRDAQLPILRPGATGQAPVVYTIPADRPTGTITARASLTWRDTAAAPNSYGLLGASATTAVTQPNQAPVVRAGADQTITLPATANLSGTVMDETFPPGGTISVVWSKVNGPGAVVFADPSSGRTTASFDTPGTYVLRLTASDGELTARDELTITVDPAPRVNQAPVVRAGRDVTITLPATLALAGQVSDDGLPEGAALRSAWTQVSGPGVATFADAALPATRASFSHQGIYLIRLTANDSELASSDELSVTVNPALELNQPPAVHAGPDHTIALTDTLALEGQVTDDGRPVDADLIVSWSKVSGPGAVLFGNPNMAITTATFDAPGTYVLRLSASDSQFTSTDDTTITVTPPVRLNQPPRVEAGPSQTIRLPNAAALDGVVIDDGLPQGGVLMVSWSQVSGPDAVAFDDPDAASTLARFPTAGTYVLRFTADDTEFQASDDLTVTVGPATQVNLPPDVDAGDDQTITLPNVVTLAGSVTDDGLPEGGMLTTAWSKVSGPGSVTFAAPEQPSTTATFIDPGEYVLRLSADDSQLTNQDDVTVAVNPPDGPPPTVDLASPADGAEITTPTDIEGTVTAGVWKLEYRLDADDGSANPWIVFASGSEPITDDKLATFDPTMLLNGSYAIRLTATTTSGQVSISLSADVSGGQKVGNFSLSFIDLDVPVAGLPIQVVRTYDSRDKRQGDFGVGWTLGVKSVRLEKSAVLGRYWEETKIGNVLSTYCLQPSRPTQVTITFGNGKVYRFEAITSPDCQRFVPLTTVTLAFRPMAGTQGTLLPLGDTEALVHRTDGTSPGPVELLSFDTVEPINPSLFRLTTEDGTEYVIDQRTGVRSMRDANGNTLTIDTNGILHSSGKSIAFTRDGAGRISKIIDPAGNSLSYSYDRRGDLVTFRDQEGNPASFTYNDDHGLLSFVDALGRQPLRSEYDEQGRLLSHTDAFGKKITYTHDPGTRQEQVTDQLGNLTVVEYDGRGNIVRSIAPDGSVRRYTYDLRDNKLSETDELGNTTTYAYDALDNKIAETDPLGNTTRYTYNGQRKVLFKTDPLGNVTSYTYDAPGNVLTETDALGNRITRTYSPSGLKLTEADPAGNVTLYEYDGAGNLTRETDPLGHAKIFTYDANGNKLSDARIRTGLSGTETLVTGFQYDKANHIVQMTYTDGGITRNVYDAIGKLIATVDPAGRRTDREYDAMGRLIRIGYADGTAERFAYDAAGHQTASIDRANRTTTTEYDAVGNIRRLVTPDGTVTDSYDAAGQLTARSDPLGNTTRYEYDAAGRNTRVTDPLANVTTFEHDGNSNLVASTDANGNVVRHEYDGLNRRIRTNYPDGTSERFSYDAMGQITARTDQAGNTTHYEHDENGHLRRVIDALGATTTYTYDEQGNETSQTDANGNRTTFEYDGAGRRTRRTLPLGMSETHVYDAAGRLIRKTDFNGRVTQFEYDAMDRLIEITPDPETAAQLIRFTYTATGQRASMIDASGTTTYEYDEADRVVRKATPQGALTYRYDARGNLIGIRSSNADGAAIDYVYDAANRLQSVTDLRLGRTEYTYDAAGNLASYTYPNGVRTVHTYDSLNRLRSLVSAKSAPLASYNYTLGPAGNRLSVAELGGRTVVYDYDALFRLMSETISGDPNAVGNGTIAYSYDPVGNRLTRASTVAAVPAANHAYDANDRIASEAYDANGSVLASGGTRYTYDWNNRLAATDDGELSFVYDGENNRVERTIDGVTTRYLVDDLNPTGFPQVLEEIVDGGVRRVYTYGHDLIAQRQVIGGAWNASFFGYDGQESVRFLTDAGGAVVTDTYGYDAFGNLLHSTGTTPNDYLYSGEHFERAIGLVYLRARFLNPTTGRFSTMDRFEGHRFEPLSLHKYLYVHADPVNHVDPQGEQFVGAMSFGFSMSMVALANIGLYLLLAAIALQLLVTVGAQTIEEVRRAQRDKAELERARKEVKEKAEELARRRPQIPRILFHYTSSMQNAMSIFATAEIWASPAVGRWPAGAYATDIAGWLGVEAMARSQLVKYIFGRNTPANYARTAWFVAFVEAPKYTFTKLAPFIYRYPGTATIIPLTYSATLLGE